MSARIAMVGLWVVAAMAAGCASDGGSGKGEKVAAGFNKTKADLARAQTLVDQSLTAMDQFQYSGVNMQNLYQTYKKSVDELKEAGEDAKRRAQAMRESQPAYVESWQKEMAKVEDPTIRASMDARRAAIRTNFEVLRNTAQEARAAYEPFLKDHQQILQALSVDLSPAAMPGLKPAMDKTRSDGKALKDKLALMQAQMANMERGVSAGATGAAAQTP